MRADVNLQAINLNFLQIVDKYVIYNLHKFHINSIIMEA